MQGKLWGNGSLCFNKGNVVFEVFNNFFLDFTFTCVNHISLLYWGSLGYYKFFSTRGISKHFNCIFSTDLVDLVVKIFWAFLFFLGRRSIASSDRLFGLPCLIWSGRWGEGTGFLLSHPLLSPSFWPSLTPLGTNFILSPAFRCCKNKRWQV